MFLIQAQGFTPVNWVEGCLASVMGLPVLRAVKLLVACGVSCPADPTVACKAIFGRCWFENSG